jgi:uncharacterized protein (DUF2132 family)
MAMNDALNYQNNPLHGVSLKKLLTEMVDHYGFNMLFAYLNINCFNSNPSIESSLKFLKKTDWAREKVEAFYLYKYKNLPRASAEQFELPPRDRIVPEDQSPGEPALLSLEDAERRNKARARKTAERGGSAGQRSGPGRSHGAWQRSDHADDRDPTGSRMENRDSPGSPDPSIASRPDPWAKWRK